MYSVKNDKVKSAIESTNPLYGVRLSNITAAGIYSGDYIFSAETEASATTLSDDIELGAVCAQSCEVKITGVSDLSFLGQEFNLYLYLRDRNARITYGDLRYYSFAQLKRSTVQEISGFGEYLCNEFIPLGRFTCVRHKKNGDVSELTLYDRLYFSDDVYSCGVALPASSKAIEDDICSQLKCTNGISYKESYYLIDKNSAELYDKNGNRLKTTSFDFTVSSIPKDCTKRQMLSYIATAAGQFGYIDRSGRYVRKWYGDSVLTLSDNTVDEPTLSEKSNRVIGIVCTVPSLTDDSAVTLTVGNTDKTQGRVLEISDPYMTTSLLNSLFIRVKTLNWYTAEVNQRLGDPRLDLGDVVTYRYSAKKSYTIPITGLNFTYNGGFSAEISAVGLNEEEQF